MQNNSQQYSDPIFSLIDKEEERQRTTIQLIPSENIASKAVREAVGSVLMNKYAEGTVGKRYYQGNAVVDQIEQTCKDRALQAFRISPDVWDVNVQPHSGSPANLAVFFGLVPLGGKILSMYLPDGGHLSHGWQTPTKKVTLVSNLWDIHYYHVDEQTKVFDYDEIERIALEVKPAIIVSGGTAYPRQIDYKRMSEIAKKVGAIYLTDIAHEAGLVAGGANESPFPYADVVTMTTHKTLRGPRGAMIFSRKQFSKQIDAAVFPGMQGGPHLHTIAGIAVALQEAMELSFREYTMQVVKNARALATRLQQAGLDVVSGGTDKHLVLVDLRNIGVSGWTVALALEHAGIVLNRNTVPFETASPFYPSGIRMGTPAMTTRGMKEKEMEQIADWIVRVVEEMKKYPLPPEKEERQTFVREFSGVVANNSMIKTVRAEVDAFMKSWNAI